MRLGDPPPAATQHSCRQGNDAGDGPALPEQPLQPAQVPNIPALRSQKRRTFMALGLCAGILFLMIVAYVSFMTSVELAALSQLKRDVTARTTNGHREGERRPHNTGKHTPTTTASRVVRRNVTQAADF